MRRLDLYLAGVKDARCRKYLSVAGAAALKAGGVLKGLYGQPHQIRHKGEIDLVTEADVASEKTVIKICSQGLPEAEILAEESNSDSDYAGVPGNLTWIIDPLDGTTNFAHGFPWFCVSIALAARGKIVAGVIYAPVFDDFFCACRGYGACLNGAPINVSEESGLSGSLVATGFPYDIHRHPRPVMRALEAMIVKAQGIRRAGAAAMDLAYVACGRLDGFWEIKLKPWDTAAGQLLVEEAGGKVTDLSGRNYNPFIPEILASNGKIHAAMTDALRPFSSAHMQGEVR